METSTTAVTPQRRLDWKFYFAKIAEVTSERSSDQRLKVGCVLVKDNRICATGYNGNLPGVDNDLSLMINNHDVYKCHAEQNAIFDCAKRGVSIDKSICYVTHRPCLQCYKSLVSSGVSKIYYINDYKNDHSVDSLIKVTNIEVEKIDPQQ
tara:strand:+ start:1571 stop:2023 length:453 start_codon:yes stop_codon:yes gene_type:complete